MKEKKKMNLGVKILLGMVLGIVVGAILWLALGVDKANEIATAYIKPFGDIFVNLLKYIVVPLVLLSIMDGVISMGGRQDRLENRCLLPLHDGHRLRDRPRRGKHLQRLVPCAGNGGGRSV